MSTAVVISTWSIMSPPPYQRAGEGGRVDILFLGMTTLPFLLLELSPFVLFEKDFMSAL